MSDRRALAAGSRVFIVGVGYAGLPLAIALAEAGFAVTGYDPDRSRVEELGHARPGVESVSARRLRRALRTGLFEPTTRPAAILDSAAVVIAAPTPVHTDGTPDSAALESAARLTVEGAQPEALVVVESASYPGATRALLLPGLRRRLGRAGRDFYLASAPQGAGPRGRRHRLGPARLIGGVTPACGDMARSLYEHVVPTCRTVSSPELAEMAILLEHAFQGVNAALAAELALLCERIDLDFFEAMRAASRSRDFRPFLGAAGVAGECGAVDPANLSWYARRKGLPMRTLETAIETNHASTRHVVERVEAVLAADGDELAGARVLVLGVSCGAAEGDARHSPALRVMVELQRRGALVSYHDPQVRELKVDDVAMKSVDLTRGVLEEATICLVLARCRRSDLERARAYARRLLSLVPVAGDDGRGG
jgi:UDP-N-acetyl-D-glucosamine dehydrogenase